MTTNAGGPPAPLGALGRPFILGVDLDGVVFDYEHQFRVEVADMLGVDPATIGPQTSWSFAKDPAWPIRTEQEFFELHKRAVVERRMFRTMPVFPGASEALWRLSDAGVHLRIITSRLCVNGAHERAAADTVAALEEHNIPFRDLCMLSTRMSKVGVQTDANADDSPGQCAALHEDGRLVYRMVAGYNTHAPGIPVTSWAHIADDILNRLAQPAA